MYRLSNSQHGGVFTIYRSLSSIRSLQVTRIPIVSHRIVKIPKQYTSLPIIIAKSRIPQPALKYMHNQTHGYRTNNFFESFRLTSRVFPFSDRGRWWLKIIAKIIKYSRIPIIVVSVYQLGHQQGLIDMSLDPHEKREELILAIVQPLQIENDASKITIVEEGGYHLIESLNSKHRLQLHQVATISETILQTARNYVEEEFQKSTEPSSLDKWSKAKHRMGISKGHKHKKKWSFILVDSSLPNAFVSEIVPHCVFITSSMLDRYISNNDELALIIGHEISHLILGHLSEQNTFTMMLKTLEISLMNLDPTEGVLSILFITCLHFFGVALSASHSRDCEKEADDLGLKLTAMACFNTKRGCDVFRKMAESDKGNKIYKPLLMGRNNVMSFTDTHPPSLERYAYLEKASINENADLYMDTYCASTKNKFWKLWRKIV